MSLRILNLWQGGCGKSGKEGQEGGVQQQAGQTCRLHGGNDGVCEMTVIPADGVARGGANSIQVAMAAQTLARPSYSNGMPILIISSANSALHVLAASMCVFCVLLKSFRLSFVFSYSKQYLLLRKAVCRAAPLCRPSASLVDQH